jgi:hypothetical protein
MYKEKRETHPHRNTHRVEWQISHSGFIGV